MTGRRDAWYLDSYRFAHKEQRQMSDSDELFQVHVRTKTRTLPLLVLATGAGETGAGLPWSEVVGSVESAVAAEPLALSSSRSRASLAFESSRARSWS